MMHYNKRIARMYWYLAGGVVLAIILGWLLPIDRQQRLWSHDVQVFLFATGLALIAVAVVCYTFQHQPKPISWGVFFWFARSTDIVGISFGCTRTQSFNRVCGSCNMHS